ncbi:hypothetical protein JCM10207_005075 [Rhodosporidiobolus poonsookiae]
MPSVSASEKTVYFISGANRGIGFGLVKSLAARLNVLIFATARNPSKADALNSLAKETGNIEVVKLESVSEEDAQAAAKLVEEKAGKVDVLIANAGIAEGYGPAESHALDLYRQHYEVNVLGPLVLFAALKDLLFKSRNPKFLGVSTLAASLTIQMPLPSAPYLSSKTALNMVVSKFAQEHKQDNLTAFVLSPGWVQTDMGNEGARANGMEEAPVKLEDSVAGILKLADESTLETHSGGFWDYTGESIAW